MKINKILILLSIILLYSCTVAENNGTKELIVIESKHLACNDSILVFSPALINEKTPTIFLLHGWSGCYSNWSDKFDLQEISNRTGFRIICPDGFYNSWYVNDNDTTKMQWRTFFDKELYPQMVEKYNLDPERLFITGLSMGGNGSLNIYFDDPSRFRSAGSMSGVLDLNEPIFKIKNIQKVLGEKTTDSNRYFNESSINRLEKYKETVGAKSNKIIIVSCGYEDIYSVCTERFAAKCREMNINHILTLSQAKHSWSFWGYALDQHLWFFNRILNGENIGY